MSLLLKIFVVLINELVSCSRKESGGNCKRSQLLRCCRDVCVCVYVCVVSDRTTNVSFLRAKLTSGLFLNQNFRRQEPPCTVLPISVTLIALVLTKMITVRIVHSSKVGISPPPPPSFLAKVLVTDRRVLIQYSLL